MDCNKAGEAMMLYMDKKIRPAAARGLARHVLDCENCREYFLAFDFAMEDGTAPVEAPENLGEAVMEKVHLLPVYSKIPAAGADTFVRIAWGISAVFLGVSLIFMYNPDLINALLGEYPVLTSVSEVLHSVRGFIAQIGESFTQMINRFSGTASGNPGLGISALVFVVLTGVLLVVLQRSEKIKA